MTVGPPRWIHGTTLSFLVSEQNATDQGSGKKCEALSALGKEKSNDDAHTSGAAITTEPVNRRPASA